MPYIPQGDRDMLDSAIIDLSNGITTRGQLNYAMTRLAVLFLADGPKTPGYTEMMNVIGTFEMAKLEFYREVCGIYEDRKKSGNGDVYQEIRSKR